MSIPIWKQCIMQLKNELPTLEFNIWIRPLQAELKENILLLYAPNRFVLNGVKNKCYSKINKLLHNFCGNNVPFIHFQVGNKSSPIKFLQSDYFNYDANKNSSQLFISKYTTYYNKNNIHANKIKYNHISSNIFTIYKKSYINPNNNFENFITGESNKFAYTIAKKIAINPGKIYNPLFIYGETGVGKTHLLHAIYNKIIKNKKNIKILYIHTEQFIQNMVLALKTKSIQEFKYFYQSINILILDDIQFLSCKHFFQKEFFYIFNFLLNTNQQIILSANCNPKKIYDIKDYLLSRFISGLIVLIKEPDLNIRINFLIKKAYEKNIFLTLNIATFIAQNLFSNLRELEGAINQIIEYFTITKCKNINIENIHKALYSILYVQNKSITILVIQKIVAKYFNIKIDDILSKKKYLSITYPRQIAIALSKKLTKHSLTEIGNAFGNRHHTTILYAYKKIEKLKQLNDDIKKDYFNLISILNHKNKI